MYDAMISCLSENEKIVMENAYDDGYICMSLMAHCIGINKEYLRRLYGKWHAQNSEEDEPKRIEKNLIPVNDAKKFLPTISRFKSAPHLAALRSSLCENDSPMEMNEEGSEEDESIQICDLKQKLVTAENRISDLEQKFAIAENRLTRMEELANSIKRKANDIETDTSHVSQPKRVRHEQINITSSNIPFMHLQLCEFPNCNLRVHRDSNFCRGHRERARQIEKSPDGSTEQHDGFV